MDIPMPPVLQPRSMADYMKEYADAQGSVQQNQMNAMKLQRAPQEFAMKDRADQLAIDEGETKQQSQKLMMGSGMAKAVLTRASTEAKAQDIPEGTPEYDQIINKIGHYYAPQLSKVFGKEYDPATPIDVNAVRTLAAYDSEPKHSQADLDYDLQRQHLLMPGQIELAKATYGYQHADDVAKSTTTFNNSVELKKLEHELDSQDAAKKAQIAQTKPLPPAALGLQQDHINAIGKASGINKDLGTFKQQITDNKLDLGLVNNQINNFKNWIGTSAADDKSRNYSEFNSGLQRLRNESLQLNKGVQTDGDAQRLWTELFEHITDNKYVKEHLGTIQNLNDRAIKLHAVENDLLRMNYQKEPMDYSQYTDQSSSYEKDASYTSVEEIAAALKSGKIKTRAEAQQIAKQLGFGE